MKFKHLNLKQTIDNKWQKVSNEISDIRRRWKWHFGYDTWHMSKYIVYKTKVTKTIYSVESKVILNKNKKKNILNTHKQSKKQQYKIKTFKLKTLINKTEKYNNKVIRKT